MLSDMNVGVPDALSYAEVPPTSMKIKVKKFGQDDAEMSPSVEITNNVQVRPDDAEMSPSVELTSDVRVAKVPQEAELRPSVEMYVKIREYSESGPLPTHTPGQEYPKIHLQSSDMLQLVIILQFFGHMVLLLSVICRHVCHWPNFLPSSQIHQPLWNSWRLRI